MIEAGMSVRPLSESAAQLKEAHLESIWSPFQQMQGLRGTGPVVFDRAEGVRIWDVEGREYLDGHGSLWLANVGYGRTEIADAVYEQMKKMAFFPMFMGFSHQPAITLATKLTELAAPEGMSKVFFSDSGSEAVETSLKIARQYWKNLGRGTKYKFIARRRGYHGVTFGALSATGIPANRRMFEPLVPGFRHIAEPDCYRNSFGEGLTEAEVAEAAAAALREAIVAEHPETVAAFIAEPVQGAGGVIVPPESYLRRCQQICAEHEVLFIADEVVTAFGRLGSWFGCRRYDVQPDMMCFAKGLTSGYVPMGATMVTDAIYQAFLGDPAEGREFRHGNTYSGHAAAAAAAIANLGIIEREDLSENARVVGMHLLERLRSLDRHEIVGDVRGTGLLCRVELVADRETRRPFENPGSVGGKVQKRAFELGVLLRSVGDVITLSPPLVLTTDDADRLVEVLDSAIGEVQSGLGLDR